MYEGSRNFQARVDPVVAYDPNLRRLSIHSHHAGTNVLMEDWKRSVLGSQPLQPQRLRPVFIRGRQVTSFGWVGQVEVRAICDSDVS